MKSQRTHTLTCDKIVEMKAKTIAAKMEWLSKFQQAM